MSKWQLRNKRELTGTEADVFLNNLTGFTGTLCSNQDIRKGANQGHGSELTIVHHTFNKYRYPCQEERYNKMNPLLLSPLFF